MTKPAPTTASSLALRSRENSSSIEFRVLLLMVALCHRFINR